MTTIQLTDKVDALFTTWDRPDSPGCALGVIQHGQLVYKRGYGMANLEHGIPISSNTAFRIGSTSKQFTDMSVALLAEQGKISLDDNIRHYLPEMPEYEHPITIRHLIHHTSGLRDYLELMTLAGMRDDDFYTNDQVIEMVARQKGLNFAPGTKYLYSNSGYYLLGVIVERASGQSLRQFAGQNIFEPLGMKNTHFHDDHNEIVMNRAAGYSPQDIEGYRIDMTTLDMVGDGGVFTTVEDLLLWDQNFYRNKLGKGDQDLIRQILTPGTLNNGEPLEYAFGLMVSDYKGLKMVSHGGAFVGFRAEMIRFPQRELSVICLANLSTFNPSRLARQVADIYLADQPEAGWKEDPAGSAFIELPEKELQDKVGVYQGSSSGTIVELEVQEGKLMAKISDHSFQLAPISSLDFQVLDAPLDIKITFEKSGLGEPWQAHLSIEGERPDILSAIQIVSPSVDQLAEYAGDYYSDELQVTYKLVVEDDKLYLRHPNTPPNPFKPGLSDMFYMSDMFNVSDISLYFIRNEGTKISGFVMNGGRAKNIPFQKMRRE